MLTLHSGWIICKCFHDKAISLVLTFNSKLSQAIKDDTLSIRHAIPPLQESTSAIRDAQSLQQHHTMMQWLSPTDFPAQQHDIITRRQEGTGQWFLDSSEFKSWLQGSDKTLFCPGIPGAGKTMTAAIAIDHLCRTAQADVGLAYLFCNYKSQVDQSVSSLLSALLKQLVQSRPDIAASATHLYDHHSKQKGRPLLDEIFTALLTVCSNYATVYIVVDALDECTDQDRTRNQLIEKLHELQTRVNVRLLFTSRFIPEITEKFRLNPVLEVRASGEDVTRFIASQWSRLPKYDEQLKHTIQDTIVEAIDGM
jgi:NACHT domain